MDDESFVGFRAVVGYQKPEVEYHYVQDAESLHHFLQNDAVVSGLHISGGSSLNLNANQMESLGRAIGNSDHLRELRIWEELGPDEIALEPFFIWIAHNRSIEIFRIYRVTDQYNFTILAPFFEHNRNLRCIELNRNVSKCIPTIISALSSSILRLARIDLNGGVIGDKNAAELINTLNAMPGLPNLLDLWLTSNNISTSGCVALRALLKNPECNILSLDLSSNPFDDECIGILMDGFIERGTLKSLGLGNQQDRLTAAGWKIFSNFLSGSKCKLEKILLYRADVADDITAALGDALAMNETLKCLDFSDNHNITSTGWRGISNCLAPTSTISELNLGYGSNINDEVALIFFSALANNTTLKKLLLFSEHISSSGWVSCFRQLIDSRSALVDIEFGWQVDDEGVAALTTLVAGHMNTVSSINLEENPLISSSGYSLFANILVPSSTSKLKKLRLGDYVVTGSSPITNAVIIDWATALTGNATLEALDLKDVNDDVESAYEALITVLCDATSVDSVCRSNHTLYKFNNFSESANYFSGEPGDPYELNWLLKLNEDTDKAQVVRTKLLTYFFSDVDNIGPVFGRMATTILPNAMEWIGRDHLGYSAMFEFCHSVPGLFK
jgi:hypothetical protein